MALSKKSRDLSDINLESVVTQTLRNVRNAYWDLSYAINNLKAQQESLALSQQSLKDNQKRVEIGTMAPIDIVQAQAEVATNESSVIVAEAAIKQAQDNLRALILDPGDAGLLERRASSRATRRRSTRARSTSTPPCATRSTSAPTSAARRTRSSRATSTSSIFRNQIKPDVNASVGYSAVGVGGTQLQRRLQPDHRRHDDDRSSRRRRSFGSVLGDVFTRRRIRRGRSACRSAIRSARTPRRPTSRG